jgi:hypothetical protein
MHPLFQMPKSKVGSTSVNVEEFDDSIEQESEGGLVKASQNLISAINAGNPHQVAESLKACFQLCEGYDNGVNQE